MKKYLIGLLFLFLSVPAYSLTLSDLRTDIRRNVMDADSTRRTYTDSELNDFINHAQRDIVNATWLVEETTFYALTARVTDYALPTDLIAIVPAGIEFENVQGNIIFLDEVTREGLKSKNPNWRKTSGAPVDYFVEGSSTTNELLISYIPIPINTSTGTVKIRYYSQVDDLSSDSSVPFNGKRNLYTYHISISYYVTFRLKLIEGKVDEAKIYLELYQSNIAAAKNRLGSKPNYNPGMRSQ